MLTIQAATILFQSQQIELWLNGAANSDFESYCWCGLLYWRTVCRDLLDHYGGSLWANFGGSKPMFTSWSDKRRRSNSHPKALAFISTLMFTLSTLYTVSLWYQYERRVVYGDPINSPNIFWAFTCETVSFTLNTILADCLLVGALEYAQTRSHPM